MNFASFVVVVLGFVYFLCFEIDVNIFFLQKKIYYFKKAPLFNFPKTEISLITEWEICAFLSFSQTKQKKNSKQNEKFESRKCFELPTKKVRSFFRQNESLEVCLLNGLYFIYANNKQ